MSRVTPTRLFLSFMRKTKNNVKTYIITMGVHVCVRMSECDCAYITYTKSILYSMPTYSYNSDAIIVLCL